MRQSCMAFFVSLMAMPWSFLGLVVGERDVLPVQRCHFFRFMLKAQLTHFVRWCLRQKRVTSHQFHAQEKVSIVVFYKKATIFCPDGSLKCFLP